MTVDSLFSEIMKWGKYIASATLLLVLAGTGVEQLGFDIPRFSGVPLNQGTGIWLAGAGFLLSKL